MMQPEGFVDRKGATKCAGSSDPFMDRCKHLGVGIYALIVDNTTAVARYTVAVDRRFKRDGEPTADFIPCVVFGRSAAVSYTHLLFLCLY